jgi:hypothetical protein
VSESRPARRATTFPVCRSLCADTLSRVRAYSALKRAHHPLVHGLLRERARGVVRQGSHERAGDTHVLFDAAWRGTSVQSSILQVGVHDGAESGPGGEHATMPSHAKDGVRSER